MSIGRLLAAGKSLAGGNSAGRYRVNKQVRLPKFGSTGNPFASAPAVARPEAIVREAVETPVVAEPVNGNAGGEVSKVNFLAAKKVADLAARAPRAVGVQAVRAARWVGEWGHKLNPLPFFARRRGAVKSAVNDFKQPAVQAELSLEAVKVVRNDLSEVDLDVVVVKRPVAPAVTEQLVVAPIDGLPTASGRLSRVSEWVFGPKS